MPKSSDAVPEAATLYTDAGTVHYTLTRKKVKNLNLRVRTDGSVAVSAPMRMPQKTIDAFLHGRAAWILKTQQAMLAAPAPLPLRYSKQQCLAIFSPLIDRYFPLFSGVLGGQKPVLKVRNMKTRWGVCHPTKRTITLNQRLAEMPLEAQEYVVLHEYVHFLHPNHQSAFHTEMQRLMPDYRQRRRLLKQVRL